MIALIDGDSIIFSALHPQKELDAYGQPIKNEGKFVYKDKALQECYDGIDYILNKLLRETKAVSYIGFIQGKNNFRYKLCDVYKANRKDREPVQWFRETKDYLRGKWGFLSFDGAETDDFIHITKLKLPNSFICCIDSDLLSLEGTHYNWRKLEWITSTKNNEIYNFWASMITGTHNGVKGIPKKGKVFAEKLLVNYESESGIDYNEWCRFKIFNLYISHYGESKGIEEFYKNYKCIKLLEEYEGFEIPEPILLANDEISKLD